MDDTSDYARTSSLALNLSTAEAQLHGGPAARSACVEGQRAGGVSEASALGSNRNECPKSSGGASGSTGTAASSFRSPRDVTAGIDA